MIGGPYGPGAAGTRVDAFTRVWARALDSADYVPLPLAERRRLVAGLARRLAAALRTEPFDADRLCSEGERVGAGLARGGYAGPEVLRHTMTLMQQRLAGDVGLADGEARMRVPALVAGVAAGFVAAVRDLTLDAQEAVLLAALNAQAQAEQALRASDARFREFATHDAVTGLPNMTQFVQWLDERLAVASTGGPRLAVCCLDLDWFAAVNDGLGHDLGDLLLVAVADRLSHLATAGGHLLARLDSDRFALLIEEATSAEDAIKVADRALAVLAEPFSLAGTELPITASAGLVERNPVGSTSADLIRAAQIALHWAKADGKARWRLYEPERANADTARYRLTAAMPAALRRGDFTVHYQPMVGLADRRLVGVEALIRWRHVEHGLLDAAAFISAAEDTGLIVPMGEQLLAQACEQAACWQELTSDPPSVSVNLALRHLLHPGVVGFVAETLDRTGLAPGRLQLELTEHAIIDTAGPIVHTLTALADLGVRIALDDFGAGYCNLAALRRLPAHTVKLDRTFATRPPHIRPRHDDDFLAATVGLARTLGLTITAEGIETPDQAHRMLTAGCDTGQGWYLGRPAPPDHITRLIRPASHP